ncbi:MAG: tetraacyldisaccharide 4'-kinase [Nitrospirota bacterium]
MGLLSAIYGLALKGRGVAYSSFIKPNKLPAKVICIGNLTLGGTGKTPAVIAVAQEAKKRGHNPCILTRGYKGKAKDISFVSRGDKPLMSPVDAGDEPYLMAETLKRVTIIKGKDRFRAGIAAFDNAQLAIVNIQVPTLFILDDGFQHWKLHRDTDVLLIDGTNPFGNEKLFPEGIMREPFDAIKRAHIIVITKSDMAREGAVTAITHKIKQYSPDIPIYNAIHKAAGLVNVSGENTELSFLRGKRVYAFSGIANPVYFQASMVRCGAHIVDFKKFRDHHVYSQSDIDRIKEEALGLDIITTEKDLVKLRELEVPQNIYALKIEFSVNDEFYDNLFGRL